jgi:hypothetical protein
MNDDDEPEEIDALAPRACCICGDIKMTSRNIAMLDFKRPHGASVSGWGCVVCNLPMEGALAVVCDDCQAADRTLDDIRFILAGALDDPGRIPIEGLVRIPHAHDLTRHPEMMLPADDEADDEDDIRK